MKPEEYQVSFCGLPNSGKSTLFNALLGKKSSIVTHKRQTTIFCLKGILKTPKSQLYLVDTPGLFSPKHLKAHHGQQALHKAMLRNAWYILETSATTCLVVDATLQNFQPLKTLLATSPVRLNNHMVLILNKIDKIPPSSLLAISSELWQWGEFKKVFMISAKKGSGVGDLKKFLLTQPSSPTHPTHTPPSLPLLAEECTREQILLHCHQEIPYLLSIDTDTFSILKNDSFLIKQVIYLCHEKHKPILLGKGGKMLKTIGQKARRAIHKTLGKPCHLFLSIKVSKHWAETVLKKMHPSTIHN